MGDRQEARAGWAGVETDVVAQLEEDHVLVRGADGFRVKLPFSEITEAVAVGDDLEVRSTGPLLTLTLGARIAVRWAKAITSPRSVIEKLGVKPGHTVVSFGVEGADLPGASLVDPTSIAEADHVFVAAESAQDLDRLAAIRQSMRADAAVWVVRPKGKGTPVTEAMSMAAGKAAGLVDVKVVRFSGTHTAEKYVIPVADR